LIRRFWKKLVLVDLFLTYNKYEQTTALIVIVAIIVLSVRVLSLEEYLMCCD